MKRAKPYDTEKIRTTQLNPKELFPEGSFERVFVNLIKNLDYDVLYDEDDRFDEGGATPYPVQAKLAIVLYGIINGQHSMRAIAHECHYDDRYRYVGAGYTPDHSTLSRFITEYADFILDVFKQILKEADDLGIIEYSVTATDGTTIKADANKGKAMTHEQFMKRIATYEVKMTSLINRQIDAPLPRKKHSQKNITNLLKKRAK